MRTSFVLTAAFMVSSVFAAPQIMARTPVYVTKEAHPGPAKPVPTPCDDDKPTTPKYQSYGNVHSPKPKAPKPSYVYVKPKPKAPKSSHVYVPNPPKPIEHTPEPPRDEDVTEEPPQDLPEDSGNPGQVQPALCLKAHNDLRAQHGAPPLRWSTELQGWAQQASDACAGHSGRDGVGENWASSTGSVPDQDGYITSMWYGSEVDEYRRSPGSFSMSTGHFTQIVWKGTTELGCGLTDCGGQKYVFVCQYREPGNMGGAFEENVEP